jgi:DNA-binding NarL/FixJ family response regulator
MALRVMIVDDHPGVRRSLRSLVHSRIEWEVCGEAIDGQDAIDKARRLKPDVILLDISMPRMNGMEAAPVIRKEVPESEIYIVSQHETPDIARLATEAGAQGYIPKSEIWHSLPPALESASKKHPRGKTR